MSQNEYKMQNLQARMADLQYEMQGVENAMQRLQNTSEAAEAKNSSTLARFYDGFSVAIIVPLFIGLLLEGGAVQNEIAYSAKMARKHGVQAVSPPDFVKAVTIAAGVSFGVAILSAIGGAIAKSRRQSKDYELSPIRLTLEAGMTVSLLTTSIFTKVKQDRAGCNNYNTSHNSGACIGSFLGPGVGFALSIICTLLFVAHLCLFIRTWKQNRAAAKADPSVVVA